MQRIAALLLFLSLFKTAAPQVVINEIGIAPAGGAGSQFTELFNRSGCAVDLSCYTLVFSSTSGGGNPTGWTVKIPAGKSIAAGGYFLLGGTAGVAGVSGGTGYPTGGSVSSYSGTADVNIGTTAITANAVYMKQFLAAGSFTNTKGQLSLLDAAGSLVASASYNNGNDAGTYPLSAYTSCAASGNVQGANNVADPGASPNNVTATFTAATNGGIYLSSSGTYVAERSLTPGASNAGNGGTQVCSGPVLNSIGNGVVCFGTNAQTVTLLYTAANAPATYTIGWSATSPAGFIPVSNAAIGSGVSFSIPGNTAPGNYTGYLTLMNACGSSCTKPFTVAVHALPFVSAGTYAPLCLHASPVALAGTPGGGTFTGPGVAANLFTPLTAGNALLTYWYTDAVTGCSNNASAVVAVSAPASTFVTACTGSLPYIFQGQTMSTPGLHTVLLNNSNGCTDTARIYLVVKQTMTVDTAGCDSVVYNGTTYYNDATLTQMIGSAVTACDSLVSTVRIRVKKGSIKDTTVCLPVAGSFVLLGQTFTTTGQYVLHTVNAAGCDSTVRLNLTVARAQTLLHTGCDSVRFNGQSFYAPASFSDTLRSRAGCDSLIRTHDIVLNHASHTYLTVCLAAGQTYNFNGQILQASGTYTAALTGVYCDSMVHLKLLVAQQQEVVYRGCNGYTYNGVTYTSSTVLHDTLRSLLTGCDSLLRTVQILITPALHTYLTGCISQGQSYSFGSQTLSAGGFYALALTAQGGCDSIVHLYLTVSQTNTAALQGCDSVVFKGRVYYASLVVQDTVKSFVSGCDSLLTVTTVVVRHTKHQTITACVNAGQSYVFNGQVLSSTGLYQTLYSTAFCDSIVQLYLVVAVQQRLLLYGCNRVVYNGTVYTSSTVLRDTVRSVVTGCDSLRRDIQIVLNQVPATYATACIPQNGVYLFNGQTLTATGNYTTTYATASGCDSLVNLHLVVGQIQRQTVKGCDTVVYRGRAYTTSTILSDTLKSTTGQCDSLVTLTAITVYKKPVLTVGNDTTICRWGTAALTAASPTATVSWTGFGSTNPVAVSPQSTTLYGATAVDTNGCTARGTVTVSVQDFSVSLAPDKNPVLSGTTVVIRTSANLAYSVASWQPLNLFGNQAGKSQRLLIDTSINITAVARSLAGCNDTATLRVIAIPLNDVYIPSAFTPNGDGRNDEVKVMGTAIKELTFTVFNRWGQTVFATADKGKGWDGRFAGTLQPAGTYVYVVRVKKAGGQTVEKKGTVTLIR